MAYQLEFSKTAINDLKKLDPEIRSKIITKLKYYIDSDNPLKFANHLVNYEIGQYRFRIGDYRVIFDLIEKTILVLTLGHRREIYR